MRTDYHNSSHREQGETIAWLMRHPEVWPTETHSAAVAVALAGQKQGR